MPDPKFKPEKKTVRLSKDGKKFIARFHELKDPKKENPPKEILCTVERAEIKTVRGKKIQRTPDQIEDFLDHLYRTRLAEKTLELERDLKKAKGLTEADKHFFDEAVLEYIENHLPHLEPKTRTEYERYLSFWEKELGSKLLSEITPSLIVGFRDRMKKEMIVREEGGRSNNQLRKPSTVNRYLATLSGVLTYCKTEKFWLDFNPCSAVKSLPEGETKERMLSDEEKERLFEVTREDHPRLHLALIIALTTGARRMEVWSLKINQINYKERTITFDKTKTHVKRTVKIVNSVFQMLEEYQRQNPKIGEAFLFPSTKRGKGSYDFRKPFEESLKKAEIKNFTWHSLRHTSASYHVMAGTPIRTMMDLFGWKTEKMVHRYTHLKTDHKEEAQERMVEKFLKIGTVAER